ncbi:MAG: glycosyl hydrolase family 28 protein [Luteolibacter sp.]
MNPTIRHLLASLITLAACLPVAGNVILYDFPEGFPHSERYSAKVGGQETPALQTVRGAFLSFGMNGPVEIEVAVANAPENVVIRPLSSGIKARVENGVIRFTLTRPLNLSVELDGDLADPLFIFANPELPKPPDRNDPKVRYFESGKIHEPGEILLGDGETLYLEGGAIVRAVVRARNGANIRIGGAGILDAGTRNQKINMLVIRECRGAILENLILLDPLGWTIHVSGSEDVDIRNVRVIGWRANSDGLDIEYSSRVRVDRCFWRTNDDCIAIKAMYPPGVEGVPFEEMINPETLGGHQVDRIVGDTMGDITITNCVLWNDSGGQGFEIGFELRIDHVRGITIRDSDIIHVTGGGAFTIHNGDRAHIEDIVIENVRVENTDRLIDFHVGLSIYSDDCPLPYRRSNPDRVAVPAAHRPALANNPYQWFVPTEADTAQFEGNRGLVRGVRFKNVSVLTEPRTPSILNGFSKERGIHDIVIENMEIDGRPVKSPDDAQLQLHHTYGLEIR